MATRNTMVFFSPSIVAFSVITGERITLYIASRDSFTRGLAGEVAASLMPGAP